jgi:phage terminase large subunit
MPATDTIECFGGCAKLGGMIQRGEYPREILLSGAAGTGKSFVICVIIVALCEQYPGLRVLMSRKTRTSMTDSILKTLEDFALPPDSPALKGPSRSHRSRYEFPNGSEIVLFGFDDPERIKSTEYDVIYCFPGDTLVDSPSEIQESYKRKYSGPLIRIRTAAGHELTGTPNHPVLSSNGWVALRELSEGDYVVSRVGGEDGGSGGDPDVDNQPTPIADVHRSLSLSPSSRTQRVEAVGVNFHGDGEGGDVDVVSPTGKFNRAAESSFFKPFIDGDSSRRYLKQSSLVGFGASGEMFFRMRRSSVCFPCHRSIFGREPLDPFGAVGSAFGSLLSCFAEVFSPLCSSISDVPIGGGLGLSSWTEATFPEKPLEDTVADAKPTSGSVDSPFPFEVAFDRVVHCERIKGKSGRHVYNLRTVDGYYVANNIIAHNCNEATEISVNDWETALSRLRHNKLPHGHLAIADCNPDAPTHWLYQRCLTGDMLMIESKHEDNPTLVDQKTGKYTDHGKEYLGTLERLSGPRLKRLRYGEWCAAEGAIWPNFDPALHIVTKEPTTDEGNQEIWRYVVGVDWGYRNPGAMQLYGITKDDRAYLLRELYRREETIDWWAEQASRWQKTYDPERFICDPAEPGSIDLFNRRLRQRDGRPIAVAGDNRVSSGLDMVRQRLEPDALGKPALYFLRNCLEHADNNLRVERQPTCLVEEIPGYVWKPIKDGAMQREVPDPGCPDHGADCLRYICCYLDTHKTGPQRRKRGFARDTFGAILKMADILDS